MTNEEREYRDKDIKERLKKLEEHNSGSCLLTLMVLVSFWGVVILWIAGWTINENGKIDLFKSYDFEKRIQKLEDKNDK